MTMTMYKQQAAGPHGRVPKVVSHLLKQIGSPLIIAMALWLSLFVTWSQNMERCKFPQKVASVIPVDVVSLGSCVCSHLSFVLVAIADLTVHVALPLVAVFCLRVVHLDGGNIIKNTT